MLKLQERTWGVFVCLPVEVLNLEEGIYSVSSRQLERSTALRYAPYAEVCLSWKAERDILSLKY